MEVVGWIAVGVVAAVVVARRSRWPSSPFRTRARYMKMRRM